MIEELPLNFHPTLFQEYIEKVFEIRSFYLNGLFYSSAIMSQNDRQTQIDFRNYNHTKPNRTPPYKLPNELENKLQKLMFDLNLNSGSIDLLVDKYGNYVFLEVNPIGQFAQVSKPCNYYLEEMIANSLIYNFHERKNFKKS
jgi:glutathione synthase/RimK-type ligase-like ATP-grasp enzyme